MARRTGEPREPRPLRRWRSGAARCWSRIRRSVVTRKRFHPPGRKELFEKCCPGDSARRRDRPPVSQRTGGGTCRTAVLLDPLLLTARPGLPIEPRAGRCRLRESWVPRAGRAGAAISWSSSETSTTACRSPERATGPPRSRWPPALRQRGVVGEASRAAPVSLHTSALVPWWWIPDPSSPQQRRRTWLVVEQGRRFARAFEQAAAQVERGGKCLGSHRTPSSSDHADAVMDSPPLSIVMSRVTGVRPVLARADGSAIACVR